MENFIYPAKITPDKLEGGFLVTFPDFSEAITQGDTIKEVLYEAADCLEEAVANRIVMNLSIPLPSSIKQSYHPIPLSVQMAAKAALYLSINEMKITKVELANRLHCDEKEIRRLLDPRCPSKIPRIEAALEALGLHLVVGLQAVC